MTAEIEKLPVPRRYRVWCEPCQDGYQGGKNAATRWRDRHNPTQASATTGAFACTEETP